MPWRYATQGPGGRKDASFVHTEDDLFTIKVTNISDTSSMICNVRIFTLPEPPVRSKDPKGKVKAGLEEGNKTGPIPDMEVPAGRFAKDEEEFNKKEISVEEEIKFL